MRLRDGCSLHYFLCADCPGCLLPPLCHSYGFACSRLPHHHQSLPARAPVAGSSQFLFLLVPRMLLFNIRRFVTLQNQKPGIGSYTLWGRLRDLGCVSAKYRYTHSVPFLKALYEVTWATHFCMAWVLLRVLPDSREVS